MTLSEQLDVIKRALDQGDLTSYADGLTTLASVRETVAGLGQQIEFDRSTVADCMTAANAAIDGRHWLAEGRGPYEWDDDRWHSEFYAAAIEIKQALEPLTKIAGDWRSCPQSPEDIVQARIDLKKRGETAEATVKTQGERIAELQKEWALEEAAHSLTVREYDMQGERVAKLEAALRSIDDSATDGRPVPEWLTERLEAVRAALTPTELQEDTRK